jgi:hypothetical protein
MDQTPSVVVRTRGSVVRIRARETRPPIWRVIVRRLRGSDPSMMASRDQRDTFSSREMLSRDQRDAE